MASKLVQLITSPDPAVRNQSLNAVCRAASVAELLAECAELEAFRHHSENLYERVRALLFLYAIHRFHLPLKPGVHARTLISFPVTRICCNAGSRRPSPLFSRRRRQTGRPTRFPARWPWPISGWPCSRWPTRSAQRAFGRGNQWMFRMGHPANHPLRIPADC